MGAVASFYLIPKSALAGLRDAAPYVEGLTGTDRDPYWRYLDEHGREIVDFRWTGYVFGALLPYFEQQLGMDFRSEYDELSLLLTETRGATHFFFTDAHRRTYLDVLSSHQFSKEALGAFFNQLYAVNDPESGDIMLEGIEAIKKALAQLDESSVVLVSVG
jgi:hypothetical protein